MQALSLVLFSLQSLRMRCGGCPLHSHLAQSYDVAYPMGRIALPDCYEVPENLSSRSGLLKLNLCLSALQLAWQHERTTLTKVCPILMACCLHLQEYGFL